MLTLCELFSAIYTLKQMSDELSVVLQLSMLTGVQSEVNNGFSATVWVGGWISVLAV